MTSSLVCVITDPRHAQSASRFARDEFLARLRAAGFTLLPETIDRWWPLAQTIGT